MNHDFYGSYNDVEFYGRQINNIKKLNFITIGMTLMLFISIPFLSFQTPTKTVLVGWGSPTRYTVDPVKYGIWNMDTKQNDVFASRDQLIRAQYAKGYKLIEAYALNFSGSMAGDEVFIFEK